MVRVVDLRPRGRGFKACIGAQVKDGSHVVLWTACKYISSYYSPFSDRDGLPLHNIPSSGVLMKSIGAEFLRPDALPRVNHMRGMQYQNSYKYCILSGTRLIRLYKFVCSIPI